MAISKFDKDVIIAAINEIDLKEKDATTNKDKQKWFRFGAYDALKTVKEMLASYPETEDTQPKIEIKLPK